MTSKRCSCGEELRPRIITTISDGGTIRIMNPENAWIECRKSGPRYYAVFDSDIVAVEVDNMRPLHDVYTSQGKFIPGQC